MDAFERDEPSTRRISVAFLQGEEAGGFLAVIDRKGPISAIYRLREFDNGDETIEAALVNDASTTQSQRHTFGFVSLLRRHAPMNATVPAGAMPGARAPQPSPPAR